MREMLCRRFVVLVSFSLLAACSKSNLGGHSGKCTANNQCAAGQACVSGTCTQICRVDADCQKAGMICTGDICQPGTRTAVPSIESVDGDGDVDSGSADPRGTRTSHHIQTALLIHGKNLAGTTVALSGDAGTQTLQVQTSTDTDIKALVPPSVAAGSYALSVTNAVGTDQTNVWVVQGEPGNQGPSGPTGPAPSAADIQSAVSAMTNLDVPSLGGVPAADYHAAPVWGRLIEAESAPLAADVDQGQALDTTDPTAPLLITASGGQGRRSVYNQGTGTLFDVDSTSLGGPLASGPSTVEMRMAVSDNSNSKNLTDFATVSCSATRAGGSTYNLSYPVLPQFFAANNTWQSFALQCNFSATDTDQDIKVDFADDTTELDIDYIRITPKPPACPPGWWSVANGRLCVEQLMRGPDPMAISTTTITPPPQSAIGICRAMQAHVCKHTELEAACGAGFNPYYNVADPTSTTGWYGDHAMGTFTGANEDDEYLTWNQATCSDNNDGGAYQSSASSGTNANPHYFHCCL